MASDATPAPAPVDREAEHGHTEAVVDEAADESFPASDPPAFTHTHAGPPRHDGDGETDDTGSS